MTGMQNTRLCVTTYYNNIPQEVSLISISMPQVSFFFNFININIVERRSSSNWLSQDHQKHAY